MKYTYFLIQNDAFNWPSVHDPRHDSANSEIKNARHTINNIYHMMPNVQCTSYSNRRNIMTMCTMLPAALLRDWSECYIILPSP